MIGWLVAGWLMAGRSRLEAAQRLVKLVGLGAKAGWSWLKLTVAGLARAGWVEKDVDQQK